MQRILTDSKPNSGSYALHWIPQKHQDSVLEMKCWSMGSNISGSIASMHLDSSEIPSTTAAEPRRWDLQMPIPVDWRVKRAPHYNLVEQFGRMVSKCEKSETTWLCPAQKNHSIPIHSCCLMPLRSIPCSRAECKLKSNPQKKGAGERGKELLNARDCPCLQSPKKYLDHQKSLRCFWISFQMILYGCFRK